MATTIHFSSLFAFSLLTAVQIANLQALTLKLDVLALISLKSSIHQKSILPWSCLASWNFSVDPCSPHRSYFTCGLTCTPDSTRIATLALDPAGYTGRLNPDISNLTQLIHLDLSSNSFYGAIPSSIFSLPRLQTLSLSSNYFSGPLSLPSVSNPTLQSLDLSRNFLQQDIPPSLNLLPSLARLDLSFNRFSGGLPKLPLNLAELALKGNLLLGPLLQRCFEGLKRLEVVELSSNKFSGNLGDWFFRLPSLQQIDLANNSFTGIEVFNATGSDIQLVAMDIGFNRIAGVLPINLTTLPNLSALSLRYNNFRGPIAWEFGAKVQSGSLRRLFLDGNFLNGKLPPGFYGSSGGVIGSLGDNCLDSCPPIIQLCRPSQKPIQICRRVYGGGP